MRIDTPPERPAGQSVAPGAQAWTARKVVRHGAVLLRERGPRAVVFGALAETVYRRLDVLELQLPPPASPAPPPGFTLRFLAAADLAAYLRLRSGQSERTFTERLARGDACFGVWRDGRLVCSAWFAFDQASIEYLARTTDLRPGDVYMYDLYTAVADRGRALAWIALAAAAAPLRERGSHRLVAVVLPENRSMHRATRKSGWRRVGKIGYVGVGRHRRHFGTL